MLLISCCNITVMFSGLSCQIKVICLSTVEQSLGISFVSVSQAVWFFFLKQTCSMCERGCTIISVWRTVRTWVGSTDLWSVIHASRELMPAHFMGEGNSANIWCQWSNVRDITWICVGSQTQTQRGRQRERERNKETRHYSEYVVMCSCQQSYCSWTF